MIIPAIIFALIAGLGLGFVAGSAYANQRADRRAAEKTALERARLQGQIDFYKDKAEKPSIDPPKNYFSKDDWA